MEKPAADAAWIGRERERENLGGFDSGSGLIEEEAQNDAFCQTLSSILIYIYIEAAGERFTVESLSLSLSRVFACIDGVYICITFYY